MEKFKYKIGQGIDIHLLKKSSEQQKLGGVKLPLNYQIVAHSDGDIILHSICNAILGALGYDDIGTYFNDKDHKTKDLDSKKIVNFCLDLLNKTNAKIVNIDINIVCQLIFFGSLKQKIKENLVRIFSTQISVKATRFEVCDTSIQVNTIVLIEFN